MTKTRLGQSGLLSSRLVYGCMRIAGDESPESLRRGGQAIRAAIEAGYNHFDHADIYGGGACETLFGKTLRDMPGVRDELIVTSKCGIRFKDAPAAGSPTRYDFRADYILRSVDGSLARRGIECLDLLLLHRPDYLMDADEVAGAFQKLHDGGKVRHFGVSNFSPSQVALLRRSCPYPLLVNQVEINIHNIAALSDGTLDQCQELGVSPEAWCPLGGVVYPAWGNTLTKDDERRIEREFRTQAEKYDTEPWVIMLAWLLKHPSVIFPIIGTTTPSRIAAAGRALEIEYSREDWYRLLEARNGRPVP